MTDGSTELATRIEVENLVVNPREKRELAIGDTESFRRIADETKGIQAVLWNEECIALITKDPSTIITFRPEFNPSVAMFFMRENKRERTSLFGELQAVRVWEGDYEPVKFTKANLLKFIKKYGLSDNASLIESVQEMKITESKVRTEKMISLDDDNFSATEEQVVRSNIPTTFSLEVPLIDNGGAEKVTVTLNFEAMVTTAEERYGETKGKKAIQLRVTNAREVLRDLMKGYTGNLPSGIPKYYGRLSIEAMKPY